MLTLPLMATLSPPSTAPLVAVAGLSARMAAVFQPLLSFRVGEFRYTAAGQKVDGTQGQHHAC